MLLFENDESGWAVAIPGAVNTNQTEEEKEQLKRKKVLHKFLSGRGEHVALTDIIPTGSWHIGEFNVGKRIYTVDNLKEVVYGDDWYKYHEYKDFGKYRVSISYHFFGLTNARRCLTIACENAYEWRPRTEYYKKMTEKQMDKIVKSYVDEYVKAGLPGRADTKILTSTIKWELSKLFLKLWFDK